MAPSRKQPPKSPQPQAREASEQQSHQDSGQDMLDISEAAFQAQANRSPDDFE